MQKTLSGIYLRFNPYPNFKLKRPYSQFNVYNDNGYPLNRRRPPAPNEEARNAEPEAYGELVEFRNNRRGQIHAVTNQYVVAYNPYLTSKYGTQSV